MKILFIDPPGKNKGLNTGLGYLSAVLKDSHDIRVLDLNNIEPGICGEPNPEMPLYELDERVIRAIDDFAPDMLGVSVKTFTVDISRHIFKTAKKKRPEIITVAGGPHITLDGLNFIRENRINYGIRGEGEYSLPELCNLINGNGDMGKIKGLIYRDGEDVCNNPEINTIEDLDAIPFPSYEKFTSVTDNDGILKEYPLLTSRGCPYKCTYCSMPKIMGSRWRYRSPEKVIDELREAKQKYQSTGFAVVDDNFTLNLKRVERICDLLTSGRMDLSWTSQNGIRADRISGELAGRMKRSGCRYVWIGIENADDDVFSSINKGEKLKDIKQGIRHLKNAGIRVGGFFIVGLPNSTREADLKSVDFVKENGIDAWWFNFVPYPHTDALEWVQANGKMLRPIDGVLQYGSNDIDPVFETDEYPRDLRIKTYNDIHIKLRLFDRLADPSLRQTDRWSRVFNKIRSNGAETVFLFLVFILRYNIRRLIEKIRK